MERKANVNALNRDGESALHIASRSGMSSVVTKLLDNGSDPNLQTPPPPLQPTSSSSSSSSFSITKKVEKSNGNGDDKNPFGDDSESEDSTELTENKTNGAPEAAGLCSSIHLAVRGGHEDVILAFVQHAESVQI